MLNQPTVARSQLLAPHYILGDKKLAWHELSGHQARAKQFAMPLQPALWGWGDIYQTTRSVTEMAIDTARETLSDAGLSGQDIDTLIVCSSSLHRGTDAHRQFLSEFTTALELAQVEVIGVSLGRCTNLLKGIHLARSLISAAQARRILVVTSDAIDDEQQRMENFALFSDGAASCLICHADETPQGYTLLASGERQDHRQLGQGLSAELVRAVNQDILPAAGVTVSDITRLFHSNVYLPLCQLNEMQAGYQRAQLYTDNIPRFGHCFAADPLINFIDACNDKTASDVALYQLAVSIPGARSSLLLQKGNA
ncbi:hypothetical protein ACQKDS_11905 [Serratia sp. NPDC078593]|uniref:hypothetical protein n=1 Tax=unclassified Serratia (in: enterobacteria) TaxID=2647522 RepID=UPI0037D15704